MSTGTTLTAGQVRDLVWTLYDGFYRGVNNVPLEVVEDCYARISQAA